MKTSTTVALCLCSVALLQITVMSESYDIVVVGAGKLPVSKESVTSLMPYRVVWPRRCESLHAPYLRL